MDVKRTGVAEEPSSNWNEDLAEKDVNWPLASGLQVFGRVSVSILTKASCSAMAVPTVMEADVTVSPAGSVTDASSRSIHVAGSRTSTMASASPPLNEVTLMDDASGMRRSIAIISKAGRRRGAFAFMATPASSATPSLPKRIPVGVLSSTSEGHGGPGGPRLHGEGFQTPDACLASLQPLTVSHRGRVLWTQSVAHLGSNAQLVRAQSPRHVRDG